MYFCGNIRVGAVTVILIVLQLIEMCLSGACKLMNSLINCIIHAGVI